MAYKLIVVPTRSPQPNLRGEADNRLVADEGVLVFADGREEPLWTVVDRDEMRAAAQYVAEQAWLELEPAEPIDVGASAAVVAAASKLDVYNDFCSYYRNSKLLERSVTRSNPSVIEWRLDGAPPEIRASADIRFSRASSWSKVFAGGVSGSLKRTKWEWSARALAGAVEKSGPRSRKNGSVDVLGVFDVRNSGMIQNVGLLLGHLSQMGHTTAGISMHAQVTEQAKHVSGVTDVKPFAKYMRLSDFRHALLILAAVRKGIRRFGSLPNSDPHVSAAARFAFRGLHTGYILQTLVDYRAAERMLDQLLPSAVLLASDAHRYSRLIVDAAARRGVPTFVLQHGAPAQAHFFTPIVADHMLAWGAWCRRWFIERGASESQVHAVGFVRASERRDIKAPGGSSTKLLFAAQPISDHITEGLLSVVRQALELQPGLTLVVRPHPGEGRRAAIQEMIGKWPTAVSERCRISPQGRPLDQDLNLAHVVVTAQSTVGIDALSAGVPVLLLRHPSISEQIPFLEFDCVFEVESPEDLIAGLTSIEDPVAMDKLAVATGQFLEAYVGRAGSAALAEASRIVTQFRTSGDSRG